MNPNSLKQQHASRAQSHIIERPRLTKLLDETDARIIAFVAPAGYGKTTLARQWLREKPNGWYRATAASSDVAAFAVGIAEAAMHLVAGAGDQMRRRLASPQAPEVDPGRLAAMLARDFAEWPTGAWLVIDDFQLATTPSVATFMDTLTSLCPLRLLLTSRDRPTWITSRRLLYGEIFEIDQRLLALTDDEARAVLELGARGCGTKLLELAKGWPAVIGLAALTKEFELPDTPLPLFDFFADELFQKAPADLRRALVKLAALPYITQHLASVALGEPAEELLEAAARFGFLSTEPAKKYDLHPLLRAFLRTRLSENKDSTFLDGVTRELIRMNEWDDAFALMTQFDQPALLDDLIEHCLGLVLSAGRLGTVERWVEWAKAMGAQSPLAYLAEAELARCRGNSELGTLFALRAVGTLPPTDPYASRAHAVAGECAHQQMQFAAAAKHHQMAESLAQTSDDARRAVWGQIIALVASEHDAAELVERLRNLAENDPDGQLRVATAHLIMAEMRGAISQSVDLWGRLLPSAPRAQDPAARSVYCYRLGLSQLWAGRYDDGLRVLELARREAEESGLGFAPPFIASAEAACRAGLRQFNRARLALDDATEWCDGRPSAFCEVNVQLVRARILLAQGRPDDALQMTEGTARRAPAIALRGECHALRALAFAALGCWSDARDLAAAALRTTRHIEARTLAHLVNASVALTRNDAKVREVIARTVAVLRETENFDSLVTAYRAHPILLEGVCEDELLSRDLPTILGRARDTRLAIEAGLTSSANDPFAALPLTRREREVLQLLCQGMKNREIAEHLVITEVTAKAHVRNILTKLGVRSRTEAVLRAYAEE